MERRRARRELWLTIRLTKDERELLEAVSEQYATTLSGIVRLALVKFLKEEGIFINKVEKVEAENQLGLFT